MEVRLGEICDFLSGNAWSANYFSESGIPIIRINNLNPLEKRFVYWDQDYDKKFIIYKDDILLSLSGTIKTYKWHGEPGLLNQRIVKITAKSESININWVFYRVSQSVNEIINKARHATIRNVSISDIKNLSVNLPDIETQNKIVEILQKANILSKKRQSTIAMYDDLIWSMFYDSFLEFQGKSISELEKIAHVVSGLTKGKNNKDKVTQKVPYMRVANVQDGFLDLNEIKNIEATEEEIKRYRLEDQDLLLTEGGDPDKLGRGTLWTNEIEGCIFQNHIFRVRVKDVSKILPVFLSYQTASKYGKNYFLKAAKQTSGIASINSTQLKNFPVYLPPLSKQMQFAKTVKKIEFLKERLQISNRNTETLLKSLSQQAFSGHILYDLDVELEALVNAINLEKNDDWNNIDTLRNDVTFLQRLLDRLNEQEFENAQQYEKARYIVFRILKEEKTLLDQIFDEDDKKLKLIVS